MFSTFYTPNYCLPRILYRLISDVVNGPLTVGCTTVVRRRDSDVSKRESCCCDNLGIGAARSTEAVFDIPFSLIAIVWDEVLMIWKGFCVLDINLLYACDALRYWAHVVRVAFSSILNAMVEVLVEFVSCYRSFTCRAAASPLERLRLYFS